MQRWDWSAARAYLPTALTLATAFLASLRVPALQGPMRAGAPVDWAPCLLFALACLLGIGATRRLWRRRQAVGLLCPCGGLLGAERMGRRGSRTSVCHACRREWRRGS